MKSLSDLSPRIKQLIASGIVKVYTWEQYQQWKYGDMKTNYRRAKRIPDWNKQLEDIAIEEEVDDPDNTYYGLSSWLDENGVLKPEYILPEFNEKTKIYILKG